MTQNTAPIIVRVRTTKANQRERCDRKGQQKHEDDQGDHLGGCRTVRHGTYVAHRLGRLTIVCGPWERRSVS